MLRELLLLLLAAPTSLAASSSSEWDGVPVSALVLADGSISVVERDGHRRLVESDAFASAEAAWGVFNDSSYARTGWGKLEIHTNPNMTDAVCASAAGVLEGKITANRIYQGAMNGGMGPGLKPTKALSDFLEVNNKWIAQMQEISKTSTAADRAYWHQVELINLQMRGVFDGYTEAAKASKGLIPALIWEAILYMNLGDEAGDFAGFTPGVGFEEEELPVFGDLAPFTEASKCSALVKLLADGSDIMISQETWTSFGSMLRICECLLRLVR